MLRTYHLAVLGLGVGVFFASSNSEALAQCSRGGGGSAGSQSIASSPLAFASMSTVGGQRGSIASPLLAMRNSTDQAQRQMLALSQQQSRARAQRQQSLLAVRLENAQKARYKRSERIAANKAKYGTQNSPGDSEISESMFAKVPNRRSGTETLASLVSLQLSER